MSSIKLRLCSVFSCKSKNEPGVTYHRFPAKPDTRQQWLKVLGWKERQLNQRSAVCSKHFRSKDYYPGLNRIYLDSVPSLKLNATVPKDKGKFKSPKKAQPMKVSEKQSSVKKPGCKLPNTAKSAVLNAKKTLPNELATIVSNSRVKPIKNTHLKSKSLTKINSRNKHENNGLRTSAPNGIKSDSTRSLLIAKHKMTTLRKHPTAYQRAKVAAARGSPQRTSRNTNQSSNAKNESTDHVRSSNFKTKRSLHSLSDSNTSRSLKTTIVNKSKEHDERKNSSPSTNSSDSNNIKHSEDEESSMKTIDSDELASSQSTNFKSSQNTNNEEDSLSKLASSQSNNSKSSQNTNNEEDSSFEPAYSRSNNSKSSQNINIEGDSSSVCASSQSTNSKSSQNTNNHSCDKISNESTGSEIIDANSVALEKILKIEKACENVKDTKNKNCDKPLDKILTTTDHEKFEKTFVKIENDKPLDKILTTTDHENLEETVDKIDNELKDNKNVKIPDEKSAEKVDNENIETIDKNNPESAVISEKTSLKRSCEEESSDVVNKRRRFKRKRLISTSSQDSSEETNDRKSLDKKSESNTSSRSSRKIKRENRKPRRLVKRVERENSNLYNIEKVITEMQKKIQNLERKSFLDEKKIETFKKALIEQRDTDIKLLINEKENELLLRMDLLYLNYDPQRICRLCLLLVDRKEMLTSLFTPFISEPLIPLIKNATGVQIEPEEGLPCGICDDCLQQMKRIEWIKRKTQWSNDLINKFATMKKSVTDINKFSSSSLASTSDSLFEEELSDTFKIEEVFSLENTPCELRFVKEEPLSDEEDDSPFWSEDFSFANFERNPRNNKKCRKCLALFTNSWSFKHHLKYCTSRFQCSECRKRFWNSFLLKCHKRRRHSCMSEQSLRFCQECEILFRWKHQLLFHIIQHAPVSCQCCNNEYQSVERLVKHYLESH